MEVKFNLNRQTIMEVLVILQLILLVVFGIKLWGLSSKLEDASIGGKVAVNKNVPTPAGDLPNTPPAKVDIKIDDEDYVLGDPNAPVTLVEFSDVECPFCGRHHPTMKQIMENYPGKVKWVYKHYPLPFHPMAEPGALAVECAGEQGKFFEYLDILFTNQTTLSADNMKKWAKDLKLNTTKFNSCFDSKKYLSKVQKDTQEGAQYGVEGTPATFVNGQLVSGAVPYSQFSALIEGLIK
ncbi:MAG: putative lipoprotein [Parcubacteria group bacterium Gr01-1014_18]|nr:MAG: putative lipoprotein [Parcubacteria group bacterium Greene0416_36]TSC80839.1 MAG: putative lipoprotein [Parcubacteria group bacterium Gr01-1014_18]TSC99500.1 MAG: putative lipoprotein [Parcubacteria group bacterium Greene1014_20]TSD07581.1 MAG: putative lipoprotein [Parcubacteria group bacterium Greene0714_2]